MKIQHRKIKIRDLVNQYENNEEDGVFGFNNRLDIRPEYQREYVYEDKLRDAVIDTVIKGFPLSVMYWVVTGTDQYEVLDGQQRTISIGDYVNGDFSFNQRLFHNLQQDEQDAILDYELDVYVCDGKDSEKLEWFKTINIAGKPLSPQELRNAVYSGPFVTQARKHFSAPNSPANQLYSDYLSGTAIRQDYLETAMSWINNGDIEGYMAKHQHDRNCHELWNYFQNVFEWTKSLFPKYRKEMKGIAWGELYKEYGSTTAHLDPDDLEERVRELMIDDDITNKKGIYPYVISGDVHVLNIRTFTVKQKREMYESQQGLCLSCDKTFDLKQMEADHITPWSQGGKTEIANGQMLCRECNRRKSNK